MKINAKGSDPGPACGDVTKLYLFENENVTVAANKGRILGPGKSQDSWPGRVSAHKGI